MTWIKDTKTHQWTFEVEGKRWRGCFRLGGDFVASSPPTVDKYKCVCLTLHLGFWTVSFCLDRYLLEPEYED